MSLRNSVLNYGSLAKFFHWAVALLIFVMLGLGLYMTGLDPSPFMFSTYTWHKSLGLVVLLLAVLRLGWRLYSKPPRFLRDQMKSWEIKLAHITHFLLYICMFAMPLSGWLMISADHNPDPTIFGFEIPALISPNPDLLPVFHSVHFLTAWGLIALILLHGAGALKHHFINKDRSLIRMLPFGRITEQTRGISK